MINANAPVVVVELTSNPLTTGTHNLEVAVSTISLGGGTSPGTVTSVNSVLPDLAGDITLSPEDIGAEPANANIQQHIGIVAGNPHGTSAAQIGTTPFADIIATTQQATNEELGSKRLKTSGGVATNLKETRQTTITTSVSSLDWSAGHIDIDYAGNTDISTNGVLNIPTDGTSFLTITLWHNAGIRSITWKTSQFESTAPTLAGTSGGFDRLVLTPSKKNQGKFFIICVESK